MNIGIIGAGDVGRTLARLWTQAGHSILLSSRHPERLTEAVAKLAELAQAVTVK